MGGHTEHDDITVIEVMTDKVDPKYWKALRGELERKLGQEEIIYKKPALTAAIKFAHMVRVNVPSASAA